jgi:hypothetical protein
MTGLTRAVTGQTQRLEAVGFTNPPFCDGEHSPWDLAAYFNNEERP